uniref:NADH-ubiquinone oxidoreductase chain 2 n=1 Tax=Metacrangonyx sp. 3 ssp. 1 MDMBR-2012 TaxID=1200666 RepID=K7ZVM9_9CRUS|nr:NADH dehydrogenase subunit 2 [Metacrangonyx sp. 3 ssp. 1 MDMBR-2012]
MFFHPSVFLFFFMLFFSIVMMICMNSWFLIWFFIEMNLLSFIPLIMLKKSKFSVESSLKYFFIQTLSSIFILIGVLMMFMNIEMFNYLFVGGLSIKLGLAPFHQWVVNIVEGLMWPLVGILFTVQKIGPFILLNYMYMMSESIIYIIYSISILCSVVGCLGGLFTSSLRKIMVFSSISHSSWMVLGLIMSIFMWMIYFMFYSLIFFSVLLYLNKFGLMSLNHMFLKLQYFSSLSLSVGVMSMGGLPPLSGFIPKFIFMKEFILFYNFFLLLFLLLGVFISLFFYSRVFVLNLIYFSSKNLFLMNKETAGSFTMYVNMLGFFLIPFMFYFY